jgi:prepilin-type processing-associated H-X9-DG protein
MVDLSAAVWRKSTLSRDNGCVEVAFLDGHVAVRDSKDRHGPVLLFTPAEWEAFLVGVGNGEFKLA